MGEPYASINRKYMDDLYSQYNPHFPSGGLAAKTTAEDAALELARRYEAAGLAPVPEHELTRRATKTFDLGRASIRTQRDLNGLRRGIPAAHPGQPTAREALLNNILGQRGTLALPLAAGAGIGVAGRGIGPDDYGEEDIVTRLLRQQ